MRYVVAYEHEILAQEKVWVSIEAEDEEEAAQLVMDGYGKPFDAEIVDTYGDNSGVIEIVDVEEDEPLFD